MKTGLTSVTFRKLPPAQIVRLVQQARLDGIEWGGDVHAPHGDLRRAREVCRLTTDAGLEVASYGSYYTVGSGDDPLPFEQVLESALALQAPAIRVWAGDRGSAATDEAWWNAVIADACRIAGLAGQAGVVIAFEYHEETLTDTSASAVKLLRAIGCDNFRCYWQPPIGLNADACLASLQAIAPWLANVHAFHYSGDALGPLSAGEAEWARYRGVIDALPGERYALIEFVKGETPEQFLEDAQALRRLFRERTRRGLYAE